MIFGALLDWNDQADEFYKTMSVYRNSPKIKELLIRKFTQKDGVLVVFAYKPPLGNFPIYLSVFSFGLCLFFSEVFGLFWIPGFLGLMSLFFVVVYILQTPLVIFQFFKLGLKKQHYSGKLQRLNYEEIIRRIVKK